MTDEERVETMICDGRRIVDQALEHFKPFAIVAAFSGGNDSVVSTHFGCEEYGASVVHCNTGIGIEKTRDHMRSVCASHKWELKEYLAPVEGMPKTNKDTGLAWDQSILPTGKWMDGATAYETNCLNFGFPGPPQHGRMFQRLKQRGLWKMRREMKAGRNRFDKIAIISGICGDESAIRAGYKRAIQEEGSFVWINPFYWKTAADFEAYRQEFGLPRNPVSKRIGISGECLCGAFAAEGELQLIESVDPTIAAYIKDLEVRVKNQGFPWAWGSGGPPKWWLQAQQGQQFLFSDGEEFMPMCVGCVRRRIVTK